VRLTPRPELFRFLSDEIAARRALDEVRDRAVCASDVDDFAKFAPHHERFLIDRKVLNVIGVAGPQVHQLVALAFHFHDVVWSELVFPGVGVKESGSTCTATRREFGMGVS